MQAGGTIKRIPFACQHRHFNFLHVTIPSWGLACMPGRCGVKVGATLTVISIFFAVSPIFVCFVVVRLACPLLVLPYSIAKCRNPIDTRRARGTVLHSIRETTIATTESIYSLSWFIGSLKRKRKKGQKRG